MEKQRYTYYVKDEFDEHYLFASEIAEKFSQTIYGGWTNMNGEPHVKGVSAWLNQFCRDYDPVDGSLYELYYNTRRGLRRVYPNDEEALKILNEDLDNAKRVNEDGTAESSIVIGKTTYRFKRSAQANKYCVLSKKKLATSIMEIRARKKKENPSEGWEDFIAWVSEHPMLVGQAARDYENEALAIIQQALLRAGIKVILPKNSDKLMEAILKAGHKYHQIVVNS